MQRVQTGIFRVLPPNERTWSPTTIAPTCEVPSSALVGGCYKFCEAHCLQARKQSSAWPLFAPKLMTKSMNLSRWPPMSRYTPKIFFAWKYRTHLCDGNWMTGKALQTLTVHEHPIHVSVSNTLLYPRFFMRRAVTKPIPGRAVHDLSAMDVLTNLPHFRVDLIFWAVNETKLNSSLNKLQSNPLGSSERSCCFKNPKNEHGSCFWRGCHRSFVATTNWTFDVRTKHFVILNKSKMNNSIL